jgi:O-methyltransferase
VFRVFRRKLETLLQDMDALDDSTFAAMTTRMIAGPLRRRHQAVYWGDRLMTLDKTAGFRDDPAVAGAVTAIRGSVRYDQYDGADAISWRVHTLVWAARRALRLDGDFVECGVFKGDMSWVLVRALNFAQVPKTFYLYDTFAGFSPAHSKSSDFPDDPGFLEFADRLYKKESSYATVVERFAPFPNVRIVQGVVPDSFAVAIPDRIAFLHLDLNSPSAEESALHALFERMTPGAAIVLDDYGWRQFRRQKEMADAFFASRGLDVLELPTGQGLVIKTSLASASGEGN